MKHEDYLRNFDHFSKKYLRKVSPYAKHHWSMQVSVQNSALLITDMQRFFLEPSSHAFVPSALRIIPHIRMLTDFFRKRGCPVFFTRYALDRNNGASMMKKWWGEALFEDDTRSEIINELDSSDDAVILLKRGYSAFHGTDLEKILKANGIENLFITGVMTHLCCDTSARDAFQRGFSVYFVADATATYNEELHFSSLISLSHGFVIPVLTNEVLRGKR